jgi:hypothetical protein
MPLFLSINHTNSLYYIREFTTYALLSFPTKNFHPGVIQTRISCCSGGCDDHFATPPEYSFLNGFPSLQKIHTRVARWFVFKPKIQIWVNFGGSCNGIFYGHSVHFTVFCYILRTFLVCIVCGNLVHIFFRFGILYREKSGNPGSYLLMLVPSSAGA